MSYLMRNGTGRNNILYGGNNTTSGNYLRRTSTNRNDISFINISSNGTYNILERYSTSRNSIRWNNIAFSFGGDLTKIKGLIHVMSSLSGTGANMLSSDTGIHYRDMVITKNTISGTRIGGLLSLEAFGVPYTHYFGIVAKTPDNATAIINELLKFKKITHSIDTTNITGASTTIYYDLTGETGYGAIIQITSNLGLLGDTISFS